MKSSLWFVSNTIGGISVSLGVGGGFLLDLGGWNTPLNISCVWVIGNGSFEPVFGFLAFVQVFALQHRPQSQISQIQVTYAGRDDIRACISRCWRARHGVFISVPIIKKQINLHCHGNKMKIFINFTKAVG